LDPGRTATFRLSITSQVGQVISVSGAGSSGSILYSTILSYTSATSVTLAFAASTTVSASSTVALVGHPDFLSSTAGARYYNLGASTNSYGAASQTTGSGSTGYNKYNVDQGSGFWDITYDAVSNIYHLLNTATGIWTDFYAPAAAATTAPADHGLGQRLER
jgi:hypothetical protein